MVEFKTLAAQLENSPDYQVLSRIERTHLFLQDDNKAKRKGLLVDVETTGLDTHLDTVINIIQRDYK